MKIEINFRRYLAKDKTIMPGDQGCGARASEDAVREPLGGTQVPFQVVLCPRCRKFSLHAVQLGTRRTIARQASRSCL